MVQLTAIGLAAAIGVVTSFVLANFPFLSERWKKVEYKREIMALVFIFAPFVILGASCSNIYPTQYGCPQDAFVTAKFYIDNIVLGLTAFAGSQWSFTHGAEELQKK